MSLLRTLTRGCPMFWQLDGLETALASADRAPATPSPPPMRRRHASVSSLSATPVMLLAEVLAHLTAFKTADKCGEVTLSSVEEGLRLSIENGKTPTLSIDATISGLYINIAEPVTVGIRQLLATIKAMGRTDFEVNIFEGTLVIQRPGKVFKIPTATSNRPIVPFHSPPALSLIEGEALHALLARTSYAMASDVTRAHLHGALFEATNGRMVVTATDGHRLAQSSIDMVTTADWMGILPFYAVTLLERVSKTARSARLGWQDGFYCCLELVGGASIHVRAEAIQAVFPCYQQVIPHDQGTCTVKVERTMILKAIDALTAAGAAKVHLEANGRTLLKGSRGEGEIELTAIHLGNDIKVGVEARYLHEALSAGEGAQAEILLWSALSPILLRERSTDGAEIINVTMPVHL